MVLRKSGDFLLKYARAYKDVGVAGVEIAGFVVCRFGNAISMEEMLKTVNLMVFVALGVQDTRNGLNKTIRCKS